MPNETPSTPTPSQLAKTEPRVVVGPRLIATIEKQIAKLRPHHSHPNRTLFYDHVILAHLLAFFNPTVRGLRTIEDLFEQPQVRRRFATPRIPKSTLADAQRLFDPLLLVPLIQDLHARIKTAPHDNRLDPITQKLLAVDGTFFAVAARIAWALYNQSSGKDGAANKIRQGQVRAHLHFDILRGVPEHVTLTDGQQSESQQLAEALVAGCFYLMDRGFQSYQLLLDILEVKSDFLVRLRSSAVAKVLETRPLSQADQAAGVVADEIVQLGCKDDKTPKLPPLRRVRVLTTDREGQAVEIVLLTNRLDIDAHLVALLYQHRWQVELFFRWLKCVANFEHFFSESVEGMTLQVYVTIIGTLLIALQTGSPPSKYDYALMAAVYSGLCDMDEALATAERRREERARAAATAKRARDARNKKSV